MLWDGVIGRVIPAGQVAVPASSSMVKLSRVSAPGTAGFSGGGLITAVWSLSLIALRISLVP